MYNYFKPETDPKMIGVDEKTMTMADKARGRSGIPWTLTSGKRTVQSNEADANAVKDSAHITGQALDVRCINSHQLWAILFGLMNEGARRIGIYVTRCNSNPKRLVPTHIHFDTDPSKPQELIWIEEEK